MYIKNFTKHDIRFNHKGRRYKFIAGAIIFVDENELPYNILKTIFGVHRLAKIEDKCIEEIIKECVEETTKGCIGSNFDDFLEEEGILEEVEKLAKEKLEEYTCENCGEETPAEQQSQDPNVINNIIESKEMVEEKTKNKRSKNKQ